MPVACSPDEDLHARAFVKVQDGCDAHCTFCIVPRMRPKMRSRPADQVLSEVARLVRDGYREVVLCGIFLGAYGRDTAIRRNWGFSRDANACDRASCSRDAAIAGLQAQGEPDAPLIQLLARVAETPGLARVRLSSLEPGDVTEAMLNLLASRPAIVPHLHLPLQSGSDRVLRRMNRQYDAGEFRAAARRLRSAMDRPAITTDVIVGFPGETESDFQATLAAIHDAVVSQVHAFPFSARAGTPADRWRKDAAPPDVVRGRMARLAEVAAQLGLDYRRQFVGQTQRVVIEYARQTVHEAGQALAVRRGRTDRYFMAHFLLSADRRVIAGSDAGDTLARRLGRVRIDRVEPARTFGTLISIDD